MALHEDDERGGMSTLSLLGRSECDSQRVKWEKGVERVCVFVCVCERERARKEALSSSFKL